MTAEEKRRFSHRARAMDVMMARCFGPPQARG
jgi:inosine/xanthosine triphosphate pyrophosphatase family protein